MCHIDSLAALYRLGLELEMKTNKAILNLPRTLWTYRTTTNLVLVVDLVFEAHERDVGSCQAYIYHL